ncbi:hypothetical protein J591_0769 [Acinetobacter baumannii 532279]|nr:hypothetical protein J591_0769 [Acinetobacter baumannii 532279]
MILLFMMIPKTCTSISAEVMVVIDVSLSGLITYALGDSPY